MNKPKGLRALKKAIKTYPEDFRVEEVLELPITKEGDYSYYLLEKRNINTLLAIDLIQKYWKVSRDRIGFCGLKDKRAVTKQYISIKNGPEEDLIGPNFSLRFVGKGKEPLSLGLAKGNLFTVTLRGFPSEKLVSALNKVRELGFANYFGEQRFSSDLYMKKFLVEYFFREDYEGALKDYFTQHPGKNRILAKLWGNWEKFLKNAGHLSRLEKRVLLTYIKKKDPEKAFRVFPKHLKLLFFFSYQSFLWNLLLKRLVKKFTPSFCVPFLKREKLCFWRSLSPFLKELKELALPYISPEVLDWNQHEIVKKEVLELIREKNLFPFLEKEAFSLKIFTPGSRKAVVFPEKLSIVNYDRKTFTLRFFLPSGSYATVFLLKLINL